jgi:hypothetical protein
MNQATQSREMPAVEQLLAADQRVQDELYELLTAGHLTREQYQAAMNKLEMWQILSRNLADILSVALKPAALQNDELTAPSSVLSDALEFYRQFAPEIRAAKRFLDEHGRDVAAIFEAERFLAPAFKAIRERKPPLRNSDAPPPGKELKP